MSFLLAGVIWLVVGLSLLSCSHHPGEHHNLVAEVKSHQTEVTYTVSSEDHLNELKKVLADVQGVDSFYVPQRAVHLQSFPCSNCHTAPVAQLHEEAQLREGILDQDSKKAHWNIKLFHAGSESMDCATCHNTTGNMDELITLTDKVLSIDQSFKQCAQCHSSQYKDWLGGSHGKRRGGFTKPRVINNCVDCHNPHKPGFETRWPARFNAAHLYPKEK
jgi:hypothetical protein